MGKSANANADALGDAGDHVFAGIIDRDAVEHDACAEGEMTQIYRTCRWNALADTQRETVAVEPAIAEFRPEAADEPAVMEDRHRIVLLNGELRGDRDIQRSPGTATGQAERRA